MEIRERLTTIKKMMARNKVEDALDSLEELVINTFPGKANEIILLNRRLKSIRESIYLGLSDGHTELNRLSKNILDFIAVLEQKKWSENRPEPVGISGEIPVDQVTEPKEERPKHKLELQLNTLVHLDFNVKKEEIGLPIVMGIFLLGIGLITFSDEKMRFLSYLFTVFGCGILGYTFHLLYKDREWTLQMAKRAAKKGRFGASNAMLEKELEAVERPAQIVRFFDVKGNNNYELGKQTEALKDFQKVLFLIESDKGILPRAALSKVLTRMGNIIKSDSLETSFLYFHAAAAIQKNTELSIYMANGYLEMQQPNNAKSVLQEGAKLENGKIKDLDKIQQMLELIA